MDINQFFNIKFDQVFKSLTFDEARDYLSFALGAYQFIDSSDLFDSNEQKIEIKSKIKLMSDFVSNNFD